MYCMYVHCAYSYRSSRFLSIVALKVEKVWYFINAKVKPDQLCRFFLSGWEVVVTLPLAECRIFEAKQFHEPLKCLGAKIMGLENLGWRAQVVQMSLANRRLKQRNAYFWLGVVPFRHVHCIMVMPMSWLKSYLAVVEVPVRHGNKLVASFNNLLTPYTGLQPARWHRQHTNSARNISKCWVLFTTILRLCRASASSKLLCKHEICPPSKTLS